MASRVVDMLHRRRCHLSQFKITLIYFAGFRILPKQQIATKIQKYKFLSKSQQ